MCRSDVHVHAKCAYRGLRPSLFVHPRPWPIIYAATPHSTSHMHMHNVAYITLALLLNWYTILPTLSIEYLLSFSLSKRSSNITWQAYLPMRFIYPISNCCIASIQSLSICIHVSPSLLEELPDCNELTWIETLWYKGFGSCKLPIS